MTQFGPPVVLFSSWVSCWLIPWPSPNQVIPGGPICSCPSQPIYSRLRCSFFEAQNALLAQLQGEAHDHPVRLLPKASMGEKAESAGRLFRNGADQLKMRFQKAFAWMTRESGVLLLENDKRTPQPLPCRLPAGSETRTCLDSARLWNSSGVHPRWPKKADHVARDPPAHVGCLWKLPYKTGAHPISLGQ